MTDVRLRRIITPEAVTMDWLLTPAGTLDETQELANAVVVALCTDALAQPDDILPDPDSTDRRGWWGDLDAEEIWDGWPIGTRNWLLTRAKITDAGAREGATIARAEEYTREALRPFLARKIASRMDVVATRVGRERIDAGAVVYRGPKTAIELRYQSLWDEIATD